MFYGRFFQQTVGIPMGINCAPLLSDLFLYLYEADFIQGLLMKIEYIARSFKFRFRYMDDVLSLNNFKFGDLVILLIAKQLHKLRPLTSLSCILMMLCQLIIQTLLTGFHSYYLKNLR